MVVDDSMVIRKMFSDLLQKQDGVEVVATARHGQDAIDQLSDPDKPLEVDVITLDVEMPIMDGMTALPEVLKLSPGVKVIMVSSLTNKGTGLAIEALSKGAVECIGKPSANGPAGTGLEDFSMEVDRKVKGVGRTARSYMKRLRAGLAKTEAASPVQAAKPLTDIRLLPESVPLLRAVAIASSTGGPQALAELFSAWKGTQFKVPIFITQHMPPMFTTTLAEQLSNFSGMQCKEAEDGEVVRGGCVYIAPGDYHMTVERQGDKIITRLNQEPPENFCRPAADPMLRSLVDAFGQHVLLTVLTGMGADGLKGAQSLQQAGGAVWAQDEASSVVWGMPGAVAKAGVCQKIAPLQEIPTLMSNTIQEKALWL